MVIKGSHGGELRLWRLFILCLQHLAQALTHFSCSITVCDIDDINNPALLFSNVYRNLPHILRIIDLLRMPLPQAGGSID